MTKNTAPQAGPGNAEGLTALGICESLLLSLIDLKVVSEQDVRDLLTDVATTHNEAIIQSLTPKSIRRWSRSLNIFWLG